MLPICLAEIEGCRPYFIGLLGERYGWVPEKIDDELAEREEWLKEHREKSVTELEILHGVLNDPEMKGLAFFYFRDGDNSRAIEERLSKEPSYSPEHEVSKDKLAELKEKIEESDYPLRKDYPDEKTLGQWIIDDLWLVIDKRFPLEGVPTELEQQRMDHEAFALLRREVYIEREEYFKRLNDHVTSDGPPLVILGESGSGKSALLANWVKNYRERYPNTFMITHYIGSTTDSSDYVHMLRRVMEEIRDGLAPKGYIEKARPALSSLTRDEDEIPSDPKEVVDAFPIWLARAASQGPFVIVLDGLNQLEDRDNAPDLGWLPWSLSPNVRLIVSTLPGRSLDALHKRFWPTMIIGLMEKAEQKRYITQYLSKYRKSLEEPRIEKIIEAPQARNPLYLMTLLEELRVFGVHEALDAKISHCLKAATVDSLFALVLERLEKDYERERKGLVKDVTALIWASRRGLSETELLELLGTPENPMPRAFWSPLYLALEDSLVSRSGLLTFFHDFLRNAVESRYLSAPGDRKKHHLTLADYFDKRPLDDRKVDELPWQLCQAESWQCLKDCVTDIGMFLKLRTEAKQYELTGYWLAMGTQYDMVEGCNEMIARYEGASPEEPGLALRLNERASFLYVNGRYDGAEPLHRRALAIHEKVLGVKHPNTAHSQKELALVLYTKGDYDGAEPLLRRALATYEKVLGPEHPNTVNSLNDFGRLLHMKGDYDGAELLLRRALAIREKILGTEHPNTAVSLNHLAALLCHRGDYDGAEPLFRRALAIDEKVMGTEHPDIAFCLNGLAELLRIKGDYDGAEPLYRKALAIWEKALGPEHPNIATGINNLLSLALRIRDKGEHPRAAAIFRHLIETFENTRVSNPAILNSLALCHNELAFHTYGPQKSWADTEHHYRKAIELFSRASNPQEAANTELNLQTMYYLSGQNVDLERVKEMTRILEEAGSPKAEKGRRLLKDLS